MPKTKTKLTKEEKIALKKEKHAALKSEAKAHPFLTFTYFILRVSVMGIAIRQFFQQEYFDVFLCVLTLVLFLIPSFIERRLHIDVPNTLEVIILLFIFAAEILGEIQEYYLIFPYWDTLLHTLNGFLMAAIGIAMVDILNRSDKFKIRLSPAFVALAAFCFSMTIGVLWEFFEYGMDCLFHMDMQKDTMLTSITSVMLNPDGKNRPVTLPIESIVINGEAWNSYIDIGLHDTMKDLLVNFIGAAVFSVIGMLYIMGRGNGKFAPRFIPRLKEHELPPANEAPGLLSPVDLSADRTEISSHPDCAFCGILNGDSAYKIYEDDSTLAFLDIAGDAEGHTLVVPKTHTGAVTECPTEVLEAVMHTVQLVSQHYISSCGYEGVNILNASGKSAQQSVPHLHFHIIPRKSGDGLNAWPRLGESKADIQQVCDRLTMIKSDEEK